MNAAASRLIPLVEPVPSPAAAIAISAEPLAGRAAPRRSRLVAAIAAEIAAHPLAPMWLVAPSRRIARQWIDVLARTGTPVVNLRATTPKALAYDLAASALARSGRKVAARRASMILLERVLAEADAAGRLRAFKAPRSLRRLAERMLTTTGAIRMAGLTAADVERNLGGSDKARDIAVVLRAYAAELDGLNLVDAADVAAVAIAEVAAGRLPRNVERVLMPEDLEPQPLERCLLAAIEATAPGRLVRLPVDPIPQDFADPARGPAVSYFRAIGEVNEVRAVLRTCVARNIPLDEVELLHTDAATYPAVVQEILATLGRTPQDGAVATRLPATFAEGLPIRGSRPARGLVAWLDWRQHRHSQSRLVRMLREGLLAWQGCVRGSAQGESAADSIDDPDGPAEEGGVQQPQLVRELRRLRIGHGLDRTLGRIADARTATAAADVASFARRGRDDDDDGLIDEAAAERKRAAHLAALAALERIVRELRGCEPPQDCTSQQLIASARRFVETFAPGRTEFDGNARRSLLDEIVQMEEWLAQHPQARVADTRDWLASLAGDTVVMGSAPRPGCLHVDSIRTGGHSGRPYTFIVGLDEDRFPGAGVADPVLPDGDRRELSEQLTLSGDAARRSSEAFWRLLGRLRGEVHLGFSCRSVVDQGEMFPSPLLLAVYRIQSGHAEATLADFAGALAEPPESFLPRDPAVALTESEAWLTALGPAANGDAVGRAVAAHRGHLADGWAAEEARRSDDFTPWDGLVPEAGKSLDPRHHAGRIASAHSLETLGGCPRKFFFRYGLQVEPLEDHDTDAEQWLDQKDRGSLLHRVLELFVGELIAAGRRPNLDAHHGRLTEILDAELAAARERQPPVNDASFAARRDDLRHAIRNFLVVEEEYCATHDADPVAIEAVIGLAGADAAGAFSSSEPVAIEIGIDDEGRPESLRLGGRIDRIDSRGGAAGHRYSVTDYKSGSSFVYTAGGDDPFHAGRRLQHGLYVALVSHVTSRLPERAGTVSHFGYLFPGRATRGERLEWTAEEMEAVKPLVRRLCEIVKHGAFLPTTEQDDCVFCPYETVCSTRVHEIASRKLAAGSHGLGTLFSGLRAPAEAAAAGERRADRAAPFVPVPPAAAAAPSDQADRDAIRDDLAATLLVEASAGTGKTTSMVGRLINLVKSGVPSERIVATTFTRKAAAELRHRFREMLEAASRDASLAPAVRDRLVAALDHIDAVFIGTFHSFCSRLLRERPIEAGLDPAFEELDAVEEAALRDQAWDDFLFDADPALVERLEAAGLRLDDLRSTFDRFLAQSDVEVWPTDPTAPAPAVAALAAAVDDLCAAIDAVPQAFPGAPPRGRRGEDEMLDRLDRVRRKIRTCDRHSLVDVMEVLDEFAASTTPKAHVKSWDDEEEGRRFAKAWKARWEEFKATTADPALAAWRTHRYPVAIAALEAARRRFDELRNDLGKVSFNDLLLLAARLLRDYPAVRQAFRQRFTHLLVDEFQDTDPVQAEILFLLTAENAAESDWRACRPKPGSLFVVGDPKQSIYRFRRADITAYQTVQRLIEAAGGRTVRLTTNFRSRPELVDHANATFTSLFGGQSPDVSPPFTASGSGRTEAAGGLLAGLRVLRFVDDDQLGEARAIARFIRAAVDGRMHVPRTQDEIAAGVSPECRPEDFLIITRVTGRLGGYADALHAEGLPVEVTGMKGRDHDELHFNALRTCLQVVVDHADPVAALALLRGPLFGFSDAELFAFVACGGRITGSYRIPDGLADPRLRGRFEAAAAAMARWRRLAGRLPVAAAVERIADDSGILLAAAGAHGHGGSRGRAAAGALAKFVELVRSERDSLTSLDDVIARLDELRQDFPGVDFDSLSLDVTAGGSVRAMNLHKVKGLEAPVVFLADDRFDEEGMLSRRKPKHHIARDGGRTEGFLAVSRAFGRHSERILAAPAGWDDLVAREMEFQRAEFLRLGYVALTRPRTCLVVTLSKYVQERKTGPVEVVTGSWKRFRDVFESIPDLPAIGSPATQALVPAAGAVAVPDPQAVRARLDAVIAGLRRPTYATVTPREFLTEPSEALRYRGRGLGQDWGTVIHKLLELALEHRGPDGMLSAAFDLEAAAAAGIEESDLEHDHAALAARAVELVRGVMASDIWRRATASPRCYVEVPFTLQVASDQLPAGVDLDAGPGAATPPEPLPTLIRGVIDLVFADAPDATGDAGWTIVDWKTTSAIAESDTTLADHYLPQLRLYARCWAAASCTLPPST